MKQFSKPIYSEEVARLIMKRIRNGNLKPGDVIREALLAEECGISRAPVREALHYLESEGLLMSHQKRGKCVTILTPDVIRYNYELSALLESETAAQVAESITEDDQKKFLSIIEKMRAAIAAGKQYDEHAELGSEFHKAILDLSDNPLLRALATRFSRVISKFLLYQHWRTIYTPQELLDRHMRIYEALCSRDRERIRRVIREHYAESVERLAGFCENGEKKTDRRRAHFPKE